MKTNVKTTRSYLLSSIFVSTLLLGALGAGGCVGNEAESDALTWEQFEQYARREMDGNVFYVLEGDMPVSLDELRDYYDQYVAPDQEINVGMQPKSIVNRVANTDDIWTNGRHLDLTYCVSNDFGNNKGRAVAEMEQAAGAWEKAANVRFHYLPLHDGNCNNSNTAVVFSVRPWTSDGACAFFPSGNSCIARTLVMNFNDFDTDSFWATYAPNLTTTGVFRHELGHILGLRHEHTRPDSGGCFENNSWRALTPYDANSVMHYPWCNGTTTSTMSLTSSDITGVQSLYATRRRASASGKIAAVSRIPGSLEVFWIAPNGSIQDTYWNEGMATWGRREIAPAGSASVDAGLSAVSHVAGTINVFWVTPTGAIQNAHWVENASNWSRSEIAPAGSASTYGGVTGVSRVAGSIEIWWSAPNGSIQDAYFYEGMAKWGRFELAPAGSASVYATIAAASRQPDALEIWWIGPNGSVHDAYWYKGMSSWGRFQLASSGSASTIGGITVASRHSDALEVWWVAPNGSVQDAYWNNGMAAWARSELAGAGSASVDAAPAALSRHANTLEVFWTAPNQSVQGASWSNGTSSWQRYQLAAAGSASNTVGIAGVSRIPNSQEIWWVAPNGSVQDGHWYDGMTTWGRFELAAAASAPSLRAEEPGTSSLE